MAREGELVVRGYKEFLRACNHAEKDIKREVRRELKSAGESVRREAKRRFAPVSPYSADHFRTVVRLRGVSVEQPLKKTTGLHPEFGVKQMEALIKARSAKYAETLAGFDRATDRIIQHFER
jgi:hypothetical protein